MKTKFFSLWQILAVVCVLFLVACEKPENPDQKPDEDKDKPVLLENGFTIGVSEISHESLSITIIPPADAQIYYACLFPDTKNSLGVSDEELLESITSDDTFKNFICEGEQTLKYAGLIGHSHYRLIYFSYNPDFDAVISDLYRTDRYTTPDGPQVFDVEIGDIKGFSANFAVTPKNYDGKYYCYIDEYQDYVTKRNDSDYELMQHDYYFWEFISTNYDVPMEEVISTDLRSGAKNFKSGDFYQFLEWDTEYMFYVYGIDEKANIQTSMTKKTFRTLAPTPSSMTFEIGDVDLDFYYEEGTDTEGPLQGWSAKVNIKPSSDTEKYFVTITNTDWYEWFFSEENKNLRSDEKFIQYQILLNSGVNAEELPKFFKQGELNYDQFDERGVLLRADRDYIVLVFGVDDNGATTKIFKKEFRAGSVPEGN